MVVKQILNKHYEGLSTDDKPVGVIAGTTFQETDTQAAFITYDGTNWVVADERARLVTEGGAFVDLPAEFDAVVAAIEDI